MMYPNNMQHSLRHRDLKVIFTIFLLITFVGGWINPTAYAKSHIQQNTLNPTTTLTLWHSYSAGGAEESALNVALANALIQFPDLTIDVVRLDFGILPTNYENEVGAGDGPDLVLYPNDELGYWVRTDLVENLDLYLAGQLSNYSQMGIDGMTVDGHIYGVPESSKTVALYYNKALLTTPPTTTDDMLTLVQSGESMSNVTHPYHFFGWFGAFGGQLFDANNRCIADQGGFVEAMQYMLDLQTAGATFTEDNYEAEQLFMNGQAAMIVYGPWVLEDFRAELGSDLGVAIMPTGPSGPARPLTGIDGYYVNPNSPNKQEAVDLALYLTNQQSAQTMMDQGGHIPVRTDVTITDPLVATFALADNQGLMRPQVAEFHNFWDPFYQMTSDVLAGVVTPTLGVQTACDAMNAATPYVLIAPESQTNINLTGYSTTAVVEIPIGAVTQPITLTYPLLSPDTLALEPKGLTSGGLYFELNAYSNSGSLPGFKFQIPITVTVNYAEQDVQDIFPETSLRLLYYDLGSASWLDAADTCSPSSEYVRILEENMLKVNICHLSRFGLFGPIEQPIYLPFINR